MVFYPFLLNQEKLFISSNNELLECELIKLVVDLINEDYELTAIIGGKKKTLEHLSSLPDLYVGESEYRSNNFISYGRCDELLCDDIANFRANNGTYLAPLRPFHIGYNGGIYEDIKSITIDYVEHKKYINASDIMYYDSRGLCMLYEDVTIIDAAGNKTIGKSVLNSIRLNDEQLKVYNEFKEILKKMKEVNLTIIADGDSDTMYPIGGDKYTAEYDKNKILTEIPTDVFLAEIAGDRCDGIYNYCCLSDVESVDVFQRRQEE